MGTGDEGLSWLSKHACCPTFGLLTNESETAPWHNCVTAGQALRGRSKLQTGKTARIALQKLDLPTKVASKTERWTRGLTLLPPRQPLQELLFMLLAS